MLEPRGQVKQTTHAVHICRFHRNPCEHCIDTGAGQFAPATYAERQPTVAISASPRDGRIRQPEPPTTESGRIDRLRQLLRTGPQTPLQQQTCLPRAVDLSTIDVLYVTYVAVRLAV